MTIEEKVIDRIVKLLKLSTNNPSVEEAASAAAMAQRLMLEHQISQAEVEEGEEEPTPEEIILDSVEVPGKRLATWRVNLWFAVAEGNNCKPILTPGHYKSRTKPKLKAVGRQSNIDATLYMYAWLSKEIDYLTKEAKIINWNHDRGEGRRFANSFRLGAVDEISRRLKEQKAEVYKQAEDRGATTALVRVKDDAIAVKNQFKKFFPKTKGWNGASGATDNDGYSQGKKAGAGINLSGGKGLRAPSKQLKG